MGISSVAYTGAGASVLEIVRRFTTSGICGSGTPAGGDQEETTGTVCAPSESSRPRELVVGHLLRTCFVCMSYLNV
jgi:hypothetical protein